MQQIQITNGIKEALKDRQAPVASVVRAPGDPTHIYTAEGAMKSPASVEVFPVNQVFEPGRTCDQVSRRKSWQFEALVAWKELVVADEWAASVAADAVQSDPSEPNSWTARLQRVEHIYRPEVDPESGTFLMLTFEVVTR